ncbi:MAG: class A beta-lactamase-related serine hydrolase [Zymomonas sp.]|nr:MAG: class A beta-lactamase-related serine hydrolase [Zymomonas sp.]
MKDTSLRTRLRSMTMVSITAASLTAGSPLSAENLPPASRAESVGMSSERVLRIDDKVRQLVDDGEVKGMVTLLARHGKIVSISVHGNRDEAQPMTRDTIFRLASMSKPVTGVALMILFEEGKFALDDPITKFIPQFRGLHVASEADKGGNPVLVPMKRPPTMRELMSHRAGFGYGMFLDKPADRIFAREAPLAANDLEGMIERLARVPLLYQPGEHFSYSAAMDIEGYIIEKLSGQRLGDFMRTRIFTPLGMTDTGFFVPSDKLSRLAAMYRTNPANGRLSPPGQGIFWVRGDPQSPPSLESGGAGLYSTVDDYSRFAQMLANRGTLGDVRILKSSTVKLMQTNTMPSPLPPGYALSLPWMFSDAVGFGLNMQTVVDPRAAGRREGKGTLSWNGASGVFWWVDPENHLFFLGMLQNGYRTGPRSYDAAFRDLAYDALVDPAR